MVHIVNDLRLDGLECVRIADVTSVSQGPHERFATKALKAATAGLEHPTISLNTTGAMLRALMPSALVANACEHDDDFLLGKLLRVHRWSAVIHTIDSGGRWNRNAVRVAFDDISGVLFGDHYSRMFAAHGPPRPEPRLIVRRR